MANPSEAVPTVVRAVISVNAVVRRHVLAVLSYIEQCHASIDPDMYDIDLDNVAVLTALFTSDDPDSAIEISFTHQDLFVLSIIIDAADTYSTGHRGNGIPDVDAHALKRLSRWVADSERWFITAMKFELLPLDAEMHRRITEVLWYVENRAEIIDPDMFRIDVEKVEALQRLFHATLEEQENEPPSVAVVAFHDVNTLAYYTMAAQAYSTRRAEKGLLDVSPVQLEEMLAWLARAEDRLRSHPS